jgi:hypothetical protein
MEDGLRGYCKTSISIIVEILNISNGIGPVKLLKRVSNNLKVLEITNFTWYCTCHNMNNHALLFKRKYIYIYIYILCASKFSYIHVYKCLINKPKLQRTNV